MIIVIFNNNDGITNVCRERMLAKKLIVMRRNDFENGYFIITVEYNHRNSYRWHLFPHKCFPYIGVGVDLTPKS